MFFQKLTAKLNRITYKNEQKEHYFNKKEISCSFIAI